MQEQQQNFLNNLADITVENFYKGALITIGVVGLLNHGGLIQVPEGRYSYYLTRFLASAFVGVAVNLFKPQDVPEVAPENSTTLAKFGLFSRQVMALRSPKTVYEGAGKGVLCGILLALYSIENGSKEHALKFLFSSILLGMAIGFKNASAVYFRPRPRDV